MDIEIDGENVIVTSSQVIPKVEFLQMQKNTLKLLQDQLANLQMQIIKVEETIASLEA